MKRYLSWFLVIAMLVSMVTLPSFAATLNGAGTEEDPYQISSAADLATARDLINAGGDAASAHYILTENVDLGGIEWAPITPFSGTFDGNGKTISNAVQTSAYNNFYSGLFGQIAAGATVKKLTVSNFTVTIEDYPSVVGQNGILAAVNDGTIDECKVMSSAISGGDCQFGSLLGGVVGIGSGTISNTAVESVTITHLGDVGQAGAIVAQAETCTITGCTITDVTFVNCDTTADDFINGYGNGNADVVYSGVIINGAAAISGNTDPSASYEQVAVDLAAQLTIAGRGQNNFTASDHSGKAEYYIAAITAEQYAAWTPDTATTIRYSDCDGDTNWVINHSFGTIFDGMTLKGTDGEGLAFFTIHSVNETVPFDGYFLGIYAPAGYTAPSTSVSFKLIDTAGQKVYNFAITNMPSILAPTTDTVNARPVLAFTNQVIVEYKEPVAPEGTPIDLSASLALFGGSNTSFGTSQWYDGGTNYREYFVAAVSAELFELVRATGDTTVKFESNQDKNNLYIHTFNTFLDNNSLGLKFFAQEVAPTDGSASSYRIGIYAPAGYSGDAQAVFNVSYNNTEYAVTVTGLDVPLSAYSTEYPLHFHGADQFLSVYEEPTIPQYKLTFDARLALFGHSVGTFAAADLGSYKEYYLNNGITEAQFEYLRNGSEESVTYAVSNDKEWIITNYYNTKLTVGDGVTAENDNGIVFYLSRAERIDGTAPVEYYIGSYAPTGYTPAETTANFEVIIHRGDEDIVLDVKNMAAMPAPANDITQEFHFYGAEQYLYPYVAPTKPVVTVNVSAKLALFGGSNTSMAASALSGTYREYYVAPITQALAETLINGSTNTIQYEAIVDGEVQAAEFYHTFGTLLDGNGATLTGDKAGLAFFVQKVVRAGEADLYNLGIYAPAGYTGSANVSFSLEYEENIVSVAIADMYELQAPAAEYPTHFYGDGQYLNVYGQVVANPACDIVVTGPEAAANGDTVSYTFTAAVTDMKGILSVDFVVPYDVNALTYVSTTCANLPTGWSVYGNATNGEVRVLASDDQCVTPSADLCITITFTVNAEYDGTYTITANECQGSDEAGEYMEFTCTTSATTTVKYVPPVTFELVADCGYSIVDGVLTLPLGMTAEQIAALFTCEVTVSGTGTGATVSNEAGSATILVMGDLNGNGELDSNDCAAIRNIYLATESVDALVSKAADVNGNGKVDSNDYIRIRMAILGLLGLTEEPVVPPADPYEGYTVVTVDGLFAKLAICGRGNTLFPGSQHPGTAEYYLAPISADQYAAWTKAEATTIRYNDSSNDTNWVINHSFGTIFDGLTVADEAGEGLAFFTVHSTNAAESFEGYFLGIYAPAGYTAASTTVNFRLADDAAQTLYNVTINEMPSIMATAGERPTLAFTDQTIKEYVEPTTTPLDLNAKLALSGGSNIAFGVDQWYDPSTGYHEYVVAEISEELYNAIMATGDTSVEYITSLSSSTHYTCTYNTVLDNNTTGLKFFAMLSNDNGTISYRIGIYAPGGRAAGDVSFDVTIAGVDYTVNVKGMTQPLTAYEGTYPTHFFGPDQYLVEYVAPAKATTDINVTAKLALFGGNNTGFGTTQFGDPNAHYFVAPISEALYNELTATGTETVSYKPCNSEDNTYDHTFGIAIDANETGLKFFTQLVKNADGTVAGYNLGIYAPNGSSATSASFTVETEDHIYNVSISELTTLLACGEAHPTQFFGAEQFLIQL